MTATAQARGKTTSEGIMSLLPIISREEARQKGLKRFFTGKPCKHGHVCERRVAFMPNRRAALPPRIADFSSSVRLSVAQT
jgi:hypothetical protein